MRYKAFVTREFWLLTSFVLLLLTGSFNQVRASVTIGTDYVIIGGTNTTANGTYYTNIANSSANKGSFGSISLGSFDRGTGILTLNARATTSQSGSDAVQSAQLFYRVYLAGTTPPTTYTALNLDNAVSTGNGSNQSTTWTTSVNPPNLLTATSAGTYRLDLYFYFVSKNNQGSPSFYFDRTSNSPYTTTFGVTGTPAATWVGNTTDWFTANNWSNNAVPTLSTDVTITFPIASSNYPVITGSSVPAKVRTLRLDNSSSPNTKILTLNSGELQVYSDFQNPNNGFNQRNGIFTLAGTTQTFDGGSFTDFRVQGGGTKTLSNRMDITNTLTFFNDGGILSTRTDNSDFYSVDLGTTANVIGENETSYVLGFLRAPYRVITRSTTPYTFGGIGIELTSSPNSPVDPGSSIVTRRTGLAYTGVGINNTSVTRSFTFSALDNSNPQTYTLTFHYLNNELNGNGPTSDKLAFYRLPSGSTTIDALDRASSSTKTVVSNVITGTLAATFTLGQTVNPLPVTLISFTATPTAQGAALLRWATATESNNRGFGIERQLGANEAWQSVGFVAAGATTGSTYEFTDKSLVNAPASTQAYYRLRQEDLDAKVTYSPVAAINRTAAVAATELTLSPVPVSGTDNLAVGLAEAGQAGIMVAVTNTQGQRLISFTTQASTDAALSLPVTSLAAGVYIVTVQVPGQAARHARFVKL